jgi:hypothetical protein
LRRPEAFLQAIEAAAEELRSEISDDERARLVSIAESGRDHYRLSRFVKAQAAPSGRARCQGCRELIEKGALRFVLERIEDGMVSGAGFVHIGCAHAYAGAVDGILHRVRPTSELEDSQWTQVEAALDEQAKLPREKREPRTRSGEDSN